jgi:hypothetical protein
VRTWSRLKARDRRALVLALVVLAPFAGFRFGVAPWLQRVSELRSVLESERDLLSRERGALQETELFPERAGDLGAALGTLDPWLLPGPGPMAASGSLTRYVTDLGQGAAILIQEAESRDGEERGGSLQTVSLSIRAQGDLEGLVRFLHALENGPSLVRVDELTLRTAGVNDGDTERGQLLAANLLLTGFWLEELSPASPTVVGVGGGRQ